MRPCHCCQEESALGRRFVVGGYEIVRCGRCGLQYVDPLPTQREIEALYGEAFFAVGRKFAGEEHGPGMVNAGARLRAVRMLPDLRTQRWLDVGCATGDFLRCASGAVDSVHGVELSPIAARQAASRGLQVLVGSFLQVPLARCEFDVVSMWDYIEHVPDPAANLRKAADLLRPGGYLALSTGNVDSLLARVAGRYWHLMIPPRHLYFFSPTTIRRLLAAAGFDRVAIETCGKRVPLDFMAWKLSKLLAPPLAPGVLKASERLRLGLLAPHVNFGDIMTVYARKASENTATT